MVIIDPPKGSAAPNQTLEEDAYGNQGVTALFVAASLGNCDAAKELLRYGGGGRDAEEDDVDGPNPFRSKTDVEQDRPRAAGKGGTGSSEAEGEDEEEEEEPEEEEEDAYDDPPSEEEAEDEQGRIPVINQRVNKEKGHGFTPLYVHIW